MSRPSEPPEPLSEVAATGDRLATLKALRDVLADRLQRRDITERDLATLVARMQSVLEEIATLEPPAETTKGTPLDELNARRTARGAAPAARTRPARG